VIKTTLSFMLLLMIVGSTTTVFAWSPWSDSKLLLTINDQEYQTEDFLNWWHEWRENDQPPTSIDPYVDWILLSTEAAQMQLQDQPNYQNKIATFLRVRSLMLLKNEEIDNKVIPPNDAELYEYYSQNYAPRWQLQTVTFRNKADLEQFNTAYATAPESNTKDILAKIAIAATDYAFSSPLWERPNHLPKQILNLVQETKEQRFSAPYQWSDTWQIIEILAIKPPSDADFEQLRNTLKPQYQKQQKANLTAKLVQQLKQKYPVEINQDVLANIKYEGVATESSELIVLELLSYQITAADLHAAAIKQYNTLSTQQRTKVPFTQTLEQVIGAIISQNLIDAEALDRHYENQRPFKNTFDFYRNHRLIRELEQHIIQPQVKTITPEAVKQSYEQNKLQLSGPMVVEVIRGSTTDVDLATRLNTKLREGEKFNAIMTVLGNKNGAKEKLPLAQLSEPLQATLTSLQPGQAKMVKDGKNFTFVRLIKAPQQEIVAFDLVKKSLEAKLKRFAFLKQKQEVIQQLRQHSTISVDQKQWQSCLDTLKE